MLRLPWEDDFSLPLVFINTHFIACPMRLDHSCFPVLCSSASPKAVVEIWIMCPVFYDMCNIVLTDTVFHTRVILITSQLMNSLIPTIALNFSPSKVWDLSQTTTVLCSEFFSDSTFQCRLDFRFLDLKASLYNLMSNDLCTLAFLTVVFILCPSSTCLQLKGIRLYFPFTFKCISAPWFHLRKAKFLRNVFCYHSTELSFRSIFLSKDQIPRAP